MGLFGAIANIGDRVTKWVDGALNRKDAQNEKDISKATLSGKSGEPVLRSKFKRMYSK